IRARRPRNACAAGGALPTTNILELDVDSHAEGPTRTGMPCPSRATLARGRRVYPSATTRKVEPENFRARGRGRSIQAPRRAARAGAVGIAATDTVAAPAPKKGPSGAEGGYA